VHVAFFNRSYYPDTTATGQLLTDLCEDLVRQYGYRVSVVTGPPLQPSAEYRRQGAGLVSHETHNGVEIHRVSGTRLDKVRFAGRATNYVSYFTSACYAGLRLDRPDVLVALTDPPIIGLAAWMASKRFRAPLVMAFQDLFPEVAALLPDFHSDTINGALQRVNQFLVRRAAQNVALGETMRARLIENKGAPAERTIIIPSWADTTAIQPAHKRNGFAEQHGLADKFIVMHSGNLGLSQGLEHIVESAALLRHIPDLQVVFQGDGVKKAELEQMVRARELTNVSFLPFAPRNRLSEAFAAADVFIVSLQAGLAGYIVPSKLYGFLAAGRPYIAAVEDTCEVAAITRKYECGLIARPGDARALTDCIEAVYRDRALAGRLGVNARAASLAFDRAAQVRKYADLFRSITQGPLSPAAANLS
jgi:glycosyltransferase involved in cell wall biosynthesis